MERAIESREGEKGRKNEETGAGRARGKEQEELKRNEEGGREAKEEGGKRARVTGQKERGATLRLNHGLQHTPTHRPAAHLSAAQRE